MQPFLKVTHHLTQKSFLLFLITNVCFHKVNEVPGHKKWLTFESVISCSTLNMLKTFHTQFLPHLHSAAHDTNYTLSMVWPLLALYPVSLMTQHTWLSRFPVSVPINHEVTPLNTWRPDSLHPILGWQRKAASVTWLGTKGRWNFPNCYLCFIVVEVFILGNNEFKITW